MRTTTDRHRFASRTAPATRRTRRRELAAKAVLWTFAALTMATLFMIVGYILVNGFYTRSVADEEALPTAESPVAYGPGEDETVTLIVNRSLRLSTITWNELNEFLQNPVVRLRKHTWGFVSGQDIDVVPALVTPVAGSTIANDGDGEARVADPVRHILLLDGQEYGEQVRFLANAQDVVEFVQSERGAIGLISGSDLDPDELPNGVKQVGLRRIALIAHPDILEVQRAQRLRSLTMDQVTSLFDGSVRSWSEVGGPSIEVRPADPGAGEPGEYEPLVVRPVVVRTSAPRLSPVDIVFDDTLALPADTVYVDSTAALAGYIRDTPGALGLVFIQDVDENTMTPIPVEHVTSGRNLRLSFLFTRPSRAGAVGGISTIIINTLVYVAMTLLFATPIGIAAAIYLVEYAKQGLFVRILRIGTDTLAGIPSIIFGLFGLVLFSQIFDLKTGLLAGTLTVTLMILPTIVRTSEEALKSVPRDLREGSMALGSTRLQTIIRVVIPAAMPGILTGMILAVGRAIGETAAVLYTIGSNLELLHGLNSPVRLLTVHLYMLIRESISIPNAFASATILVAIVFLVNYLTRRLISGRNRRVQ